MHRVEPQTADAQPLEVVEPADEAGQVADPIAVAVLEGLDVEAVDDGLAVPPVGHDLVVPGAPGATPMTMGACQEQSSSRRPSTRASPGRCCTGTPPTPSSRACCSSRSCRRG